MILAAFIALGADADITITTVLSKGFVSLTSPEVGRLLGVVVQMQ